MKVIGYTGVTKESTGRSCKQALEGQCQRLRDVAEANGWVMVECFNEVLGLFGGRPELETAMARLDDGIAEALLVLEVRDYASILGRRDAGGWTIVTPDGPISADDEIHAPMIAAIQDEVERFFRDDDGARSLT